MPSSCVCLSVCVCLCVCHTPVLGYFVVAEFLWTSASRGPSAIAEPVVRVVLIFQLILVVTYVPKTQIEKYVLYGYNALIHFRHRQTDGQTDTDIVA